MTDWGLNAGTDFNTQDVEVGEIIEGIEADDKIKKRKYDFIIPFIFLKKHWETKTP